MPPTLALPRVRPLAGRGEGTGSHRDGIHEGLAASVPPPGGGGQVGVDDVTRDAARQCRAGAQGAAKRETGALPL